MHGSGRKTFIPTALTIVIPVPRPPRDGILGGGCVIILVAAALPLSFIEEVDEEPQRFRGLPRLLLHRSSGNVKLS